MGQTGGRTDTRPLIYAFRRYQFGRYKRFDSAPLYEIVQKKLQSYAQHRTC